MAKADDDSVLGKILRENAGATAHGEHAEALFLTSSFTFANAKEAADKFSQPGADYIYSRFSNPTVKTLNRRMALLEGGECALSAASGMAAIMTTLLGICEQGDRVVCAADIFGATAGLLNKHLSRFGIGVTFVYGTDMDAWRAATAAGAKVLLLETPSNPMQEVTDLAALSEVAKRAGALLAVDNCFTAGLQRPLSQGADIVIHSGTKYLDGQGRILGGIIIGGENY